MKIFNKKLLPITLLIIGISIFAFSVNYSSAIVGKWKIQSNKQNVTIIMQFTGSGQIIQTTTASYGGRKSKFTVKGTYKVKGDMLYTEMRGRKGKGKILYIKAGVMKIKSLSAMNKGQTYIYKRM
jgi:uncharacterized protein (TIGR03066 family)